MGMQALHKSVKSLYRRLYLIVIDDSMELEDWSSYLDESLDLKRLTGAG
jgi:hypothetical protein